MEPLTTGFVHPPPSTHTHTQHPGSSQLIALREREDALRAELLTTQRENMTLRFDYEQAILELPRLKVRISFGILLVRNYNVNIILLHLFPIVQSRLSDQQLYVEALQSSGAGDNVRPITSKKVRTYLYLYTVYN